MESSALPPAHRPGLRRRALVLRAAGHLPHRFILGTVGKSPWPASASTPSTARPGALDNTLKSVQRLALANGFDSFLMFNVSPSGPPTPTIWTPSRTRPWPRKNLVWLEAMLAQTRPVMWAAWGTLIEKRPYLPGMMRRMVAITQRYDIPWVTFGKRSAGRAPASPAVPAQGAKRPSPLTCRPTWTRCSPA